MTAISHTNAPPPDGRIPHLLDGRLRTDATELLAVRDPATGRSVAQVPVAEELVDEAVAGALDAFADWGNRSIGRRMEVLFAFRGLLRDSRDELAQLITAQHGKTLDDALGEVDRGIEVVDFACGAGHLLKGEFSAQVSSGVDTWSLRQPLGVVACVSPFNFPVMVPLWTIPIALACGNSVVLKPSERDPAAPLRLGELALEAGLPAGALQVLQGDARTVQRLVDHPDVQALSFVGSTPVAKHLYERGAAAGKRVQALGGAKNHAVVLPDADLDQAADAITGAAYGSAGERCMAVSVVVAVGDAAQPLVDRLRARAIAVRVGAGDQPDIDMGPLITEEHRDRVRGYVDRGSDEADLVVDGRASTDSEGFFLGPTLFDHVDPTAELYREEIFGPVLSVVRVATLDQALELLRVNLYGNGAAVFTRSGAVARRFQQEAAAGMIGINVPIPVPMAYHSFGGWKASLFGDLHMHGMDGVRFHTRLKTVTARWPASDPADGFAFPGSGR